MRQTFNAVPAMPSIKKIDILIVDDDEAFRETLARRLTRSGFQLQTAADGGQAMNAAQRRDFDVAVIDMKMPGMSGLELLERLKQEHADCEVVILTGQGTIESAVEAMKLDAYDYLTKPFPMQELESLISKAYERRQLRTENRRLRALLERQRPTDEIIGESPAMKEVYRLTERAAMSGKAILIQGESGTGKELVARALHRNSPRADRPLVVINCAALPEALLESELFGHEKGAFTGAIRTKPGLFEVADGGTLFVDEIGEMPGSLQAKLLRVLEDGSLRRIGSIKERRVDVRLLAATNSNLAQLVADGQFREDLYYRINVISLELPPLRNRQGDVALLLDHFVGPNWRIEEAARRALLRYAWPGNVRQLMNAVERAKITGQSPTLRRNDFPREVIEDGHAMTRTPPIDSDNLAAIERAKVVEVLRREAGNKTRAARALGVDRRKLYRLVEKHTIQMAEFR